GAGGFESSGQVPEHGRIDDHSGPPIAVWNSPILSKLPIRRGLRRDVWRAGSASGALSIAPQDAPRAAPRGTPQEPASGGPYIPSRRDYLHRLRQQGRHRAHLPERPDSPHHSRRGMGANRKRPDAAADGAEPLSA